MFERKPLRQHVQKEILARLADNRLAAGTRINESHLSAELGISRTPLREAMLGLESTGFLASDMGRGFMVPALSRPEFQQCQAILHKLAPYALSLAQPLPTARIMELNNLLGRARMRVTQPGPEQGGAVADLVFRWSYLSVAGCPNQVLMADVNRLEALSRRYWREAVAHSFAPDAMLASYSELYDLLRTNQLDQAVEHWARHLARFAAEAALRLPAPSPET